MKNTLLSKLFIISTAAILSACGGGGDSSSSSTAAPTYGAIYVNALLGAGISANYSSPALAAETAKAQCVSKSTTTYQATT